MPEKKKEVHIIRDIVFPPAISTIYIQDDSRVDIIELNYTRPYCNLKFKEVFFDKPSVIEAGYRLELSTVDKRWVYPTSDLSQAKTILFFYNQDIIEMNCYQPLSNGFMSFEQFSETTGSFIAL